MSLTLIERFIIEAIYKGKKTLPKISKELGLAPELVSSICEYLANKDVLKKVRDEYELGAFPEKFEIIQELNDITTHLNGLWESNKSELKLRKFYCSSEQEKMLQALVKNLESFISELERNKAPLAKHKLLYMGLANYQDIILEDLK